MDRKKFELTLKILNNALRELSEVNEDNKKSGEKIQLTELIYFCRHLCISPRDLQTGSDVTVLLQNFQLVLTNSKDDIKVGILATLKSLMDTLNFADPTNFKRRHVPAYEKDALNNI